MLENQPIKNVLKNRDLYEAGQEDITIRTKENKGCVNDIQNVRPDL